MALNHKPVASITAEDIKQLVGEKEPERRLIDFKSELPSFKDDKKKKEFLLDVASFANADGGDIVFGIKEDGKGRAEEIVGVTIENPDSLMRQMQEIVAKGIKPQVKIDFSDPPITVDGVERPVLVLRVHRSWRPPHGVGTEYLAFSTRGPKGNIPMDIETIRHSFIGSEVLEERINAFRFKRIDEVLSGQTPSVVYGIAPNVLVKDNERFGLFVLHFMPVISFVEGRPIDLKPLVLSEEWRQLWDITGFSASPQFSFEGLYSAFGSGDKTHPAQGYILIFRNGSVELCVTARTGRTSKGDTWGVYNYTKEIGGLFNWTLSFLQNNLLVVPPIAVAFSFLNCRSICLIPSSPTEDWSSPIERDHLIFPTELLEEYLSTPNEFLDPIYDRLWQTVGRMGIPRNWSRAEPK